MVDAIPMLTALTIARAMPSNALAEQDSLTLVRMAPSFAQVLYLCIDGSSKFTSNLLLVRDFRQL